VKKTQKHRNRQSKLVDDKIGGSNQGKTVTKNCPARKIPGAKTLGPTATAKRSKPPWEAPASRVGRQGGGGRVRAGMNVGGKNERGDELGQNKPQVSPGEKTACG